MPVKDFTSLYFVLCGREKFIEEFPDILIFEDSLYHYNDNIFFFNEFPEIFIFEALPCSHNDNIFPSSASSVSGKTATASCNSVPNSL